MSTTPDTPKPDMPRKPLSDDEAAVLDGVLAHLSAYDRVPADPKRVLDVDGCCEKSKRAIQWMNVIGQCPCDTPPVDLTHRTLAKIKEARLREKFAASAPAVGRRTHWSWAEFGAVAAMFVIGVVLLWPVVHRTPQDTARTIANNNMSVAGTAMGSYGNSLNSLFKSPWVSPPTLTGLDNFNLDLPPAERGPGLIRVSPLDPAHPGGQRLLTVTIPDPATTPGLSFGFSAATQGDGQFLHIQRPDGMRFRIQLPPDIQVHWNDNNPSGHGMWIIRGTLPPATESQQNQQSLWPR